MNPIIKALKEQGRRIVRIQLSNGAYVYAVSSNN